MCMWTPVLKACVITCPEQTDLRMLSMPVSHSLDFSLYSRVGYRWDFMVVKGKCGWLKEALKFQVGKGTFVSHFFHVLIINSSWKVNIQWLLHYKLLAFSLPLKHFLQACQYNYVLCLARRLFCLKLVIFSPACHSLLIQLSCERLLLY